MAYKKSIRTDKVRTRAQLVCDEIGYGEDLGVLRTVHGLLFFGDEVVVTQRRADAKHQPGKFQLVGGRVQPGEGVLNAVVREAFADARVRLVPHGAAQVFERPLEEDPNKCRISTLVTGCVLTREVIAGNDVAWAGFMPLEEVFRRIDDFQSDTPELLAKAGTMSRFGGLVTAAAQLAER